MVTLVAWIYLFSMTSKMNAAVMDMAAELAMPAMQSWGVVEIVFLFMMWAVMMVAMMVPAAAPLILIFARANRQNGSNQVVGSAGILLFGYLLVWVGFSVVATLMQWGLHSTTLLSPLTVSTSATLGGVLLMVVGAFQFTSLKRACLVWCRSPLSFLMSHWREGQWGTFVTGLKHGAYCLGCCWLLMMLMFVGGVTSLLWMAAIAVFVLVEKIAPRGELIGRIAGGMLIAGGIVRMIQ